MSNRDAAGWQIEEDARSPLTNSAEVSGDRQVGLRLCSAVSFRRGTGGLGSKREVSDGRTALLLLPRTWPHDVWVTPQAGTPAGSVELLLAVERRGEVVWNFDGDINERWYADGDAVAIWSRHCLVTGS
jgi:hypothetical protein